MMFAYQNLSDACFGRVVSRDCCLSKVDKNYSISIEYAFVDLFTCKKPTLEENTMRNLQT